MNRDTAFFKQAELMLRMIPFVGRESCFALKGGSAINFFVRDLPRLSVDIDLTYLPLESREVSLENISQALARIAVAAQKAHRHFRVHESRSRDGKRISKIFVNDGSSQITIEPNEVLRGTVFGAEERTISARAQEVFELSATMPVLSVPDLYGGKLCAALDRQHPRDLFDVKLLLENEGMIPDIRRAFVVYLAGHDRPIHELIDPTRKNMRAVFEAEFAGMTAQPVTYDQLVEARERCISELQTSLTTDERTFLVSLKECNPQWGLIEIKGIETLPSVQWKLINLKRMKETKPAKHAEQLQKLRTSLGI